MAAEGMLLKLALEPEVICGSSLTSVCKNPLLDNASLTTGHSVIEPARLSSGSP